MSATPLSFAAISARSLDDSIAFYRDVIGFDVDAEGIADADLGKLLGLPDGTPVRCALLSACGLAVGRILLFEADLPARAPARKPGDRTTRGLWNINFYVDDIVAVSRALCDRFEFWSEPKRYPVSPTAGDAIEVVFEAPDGVAVNLVQPLGDPDTFIGKIRAQADAFGRTRTGFTPVATTAHCVHDMAAARGFYQAMLGVTVVLDEKLGRPETNIFLARAPGSIAHTVFLQGDHFFGKLSLNEPCNFDVPDRIAGARPDAIGYAAQGFVVPDIDVAISAGLAAGGTLLRRGAMALPGFSGEAAALLRAPGEGVLAWLVQSPPAA